MKTALLLLMCLSAALPASAERLDDSLSTQQQFDLDLNWKQQRNTENLNERELNALSARAPRVEIRLNTARFVGQRGKIFPAPSPFGQVCSLLARRFDFGFSGLRIDFDQNV